MSFFREIGRIAEDIGDFFDPPEPTMPMPPAGPTAAEMAEQEAEAGAYARRAARDADMQRRRRQQMLAGTRSLTTGMQMRGGAAALGGSKTGAGMMV